MKILYNCRYSIKYIFSYKAFFFIIRPWNYILLLLLYNNSKGFLFIFSHKWSSLVYIIIYKGNMNYMNATIKEILKNKMDIFYKRSTIAMHKSAELFMKKCTKRERDRSYRLAMNGIREYHQYKNIECWL